MENEIKTEVENKPVLRFDIKTETDLIKAIAKLFPASTNPYTEEQAIKKEGSFCVMDPTNCTMIIAKTEEARRILSRFIDIDSDERLFKVPELNYCNTIFKQEKPLSDDEKATIGYNQVSKYGLIFLLPIIKIFDAMYIHRRNDCENASVEISLKNDYPATIENDHFKMIVAPRVDSD